MLEAWFIRFPCLRAHPLLNKLPTLIYYGGKYNDLHQFHLFAGFKCLFEVLSQANNDSETSIWKDKMLEKAQQLFDSSTSFNWRSCLHLGLMSAAWVCEDKGNYPEALYYFNRSITAIEDLLRTNDTNDLHYIFLVVLHQCASIESELGNEDSAYQFFVKSQSCIKSIDTNTLSSEQLIEVADTLLDFALYLLSHCDLSQVAENASRAIEISEPLFEKGEIQYDAGYIAAYSMLIQGIYYSNSGNHDLSTSWFNKGLKITQTLESIVTNQEQINDIKNIQNLIISQFIN